MEKASKKELVIFGKKVIKKHKPALIRLANK